MDVSSMLKLCDAALLLKTEGDDTPKAGQKFVFSGGETDRYDIMDDHAVDGIKLQTVMESDQQLEQFKQIVEDVSPKKKSTKQRGKRN